MGTLTVPPHPVGSEELTAWLTTPTGAQWAATQEATAWALRWCEVMLSYLRQIQDTGQVWPQTEYVMWCRRRMA